MAVTTPPLPDDELEQRLDDLIPRSQPSWRRLATSGAIVAVAIAITVLNFGGWIYPRPTDSVSWSSGGWLEAHPDVGLVATEVMFPNRSNRDIRVTSVTLDGPGARLARVQLHLDEEILASSDSAEPIETVTPVEADGVSTTETTSLVTPLDTGSRPLADLPAVIPAGRTGRLVLWFEPVDCDGTAAPWGVAEATVDFGAGAFPPFARTIRLDEDPIAEPGETITVMVADASFTGDSFSGPTALAAACEALR